MRKYYLAIDIGASSGRHILGHMERGKMVLEEIYCFSNGMLQQNGELVWDVDYLFREIKEGMKKCLQLNKVPVSVGIDTWGVDFVLLDKEDKRIGEAVAYRDARTNGMDKEVSGIFSEKELYYITGIQKQQFNTIYQLMALNKKRPDQLKKARKLLMLPDYFHFLLTGRTVTEYTNATTTQLVSPETRSWNITLIKKLGLPESIFQPIQLPGYELGQLTKDMQMEIGYNCKVVLPATHDTGSAVMAVPGIQKEILYISSGTWSLMGTELPMANCSLESMEHNLTNEGGYDYRFRYLKNIMGLWMIQSVKEEIGGELDYNEICELASKEAITSIVDCNDNRFLAPANMTEEIQDACRESAQQIPQGVGEVAAVIYHSLAVCYAKTVKEIESMTGKKYDCIHIVGGGSNATYLNQLTARQTGLNVYTGPTEATSIGNLTSQMIAEQELYDLRDARTCIRNSFSIGICEA